MKLRCGFRNAFKKDKNIHEMNCLNVKHYSNTVKEILSIMDIGM